jgi:hypothetical protein
VTVPSPDVYVCVYYDVLESSIAYYAAAIAAYIAFMSGFVPVLVLL